MAVDFGELVVANAMSVMGLPIRVSPLRSAPNMPAYDATGIWSRRHVQLMLDGGAELSTTTLKIAIYENDPAFSVTGAPIQGDEVYLTLLNGQVLSFKIDDIQPDGQGGVDLYLKFLVYPETKAMGT